MDMNQAWNSFADGVTKAARTVSNVAVDVYGQGKNTSKRPTSSASCTTSSPIWESWFRQPMRGALSMRRASRRSTPRSPS